ncbi:primosomal protein N' [Peptacetobacter sp.]|uniref:primosomal protein N' n=1 Tax=Peptacetobacter sp. TaxID=2991975 RepID=UPI002603D37C|nr:primosomal protein N' [Peptacetobacter sp.]
MYAEVIVRSNTVYTDNLFTYKIPDFLEEIIRIGHRVLVPFGKSNKPIEAFVFKIKNNYEKQSNIKIKEIEDILDEEPLFTPEQLSMVHWMKNRYLCTYMDCINMIYPKGLKVKNYKVISLKEGYLEEYNNLSEDEKKIIRNISENKGKIKVDKLKYIKNINNLLYKMKNKKIIDIKWEYTSTKNEKKIIIVSLSSYIENIDEYISENKIKIGVNQRKIIDFLKLNEEVEINDIIEILKISKQSINSLEKKGIITFKEEDFFRKPKLTYKEKAKKIELNEQQKEVSEIIKGEMFSDNKKPYILHGITGSGKTEVYMDIVDFALSQGLDSIILVPEISLTPQTVSRIKNRFGEIVGVFHSQLSEGEKHDVFRAVRKGEIRILIGARSALFAPFRSLGVVIIDEFHESSYKSEMNPKFNAIEVARYMSFKNNITLVMGSATPSIEEYYRAKTGDYKLLKIDKRANSKPLPKIKAIDMKQELNEGNKSVFSRELIEKIKENTYKKNQTILFLNRRGYANFISCRNCGYVMKCEHCDISLTYHKRENTARCHYCGFEKKVPKECPECKSKYLKPFGTGTQRIEEELKKLIPDIKVLRMDKDTTARKGETEEILGKFKNKEADVLIGTQMISKGLDFPDVTLVGIMSADMMLNFPDFKSFETTFQLITQVAGRAGRAEKEGEVLLQSYNIDNYAIKNAMEYNFEKFYENEIKIRESFEYPPFRNIISVVISGDNEEKVKKNIYSMYNSLKYLFKGRGYDDLSFILGPNPCTISKINKNYRWQLLFKDDFVEINLLKGIIKYVCITKRDVVFDKNINISISVNPNSVL